MKRIDNAVLKASGVCGVLAPLTGFTCILLAVASHPQFSWFDNALSDLGVIEGVTEVIFNLGLIISGALALVFGAGLFSFLHERAIGMWGALVFVLNSLSLILIGVFSENSGSIHDYVSIAFFTLFPISMLMVCAAFLLSSNLKMGLFTFVAAASAAVVWIVQFALRPFPEVAIPEAVSALVGSVWVVVVGFKMFNES